MKSSSDMMVEVATCLSPRALLLEIREILSSKDCLNDKAEAWWVTGNVGCGVEALSIGRGARCSLRENRT